MQRTVAILLLLLSAAAAAAQQKSEGTLASDMRREREALASSCGNLKGAFGCAQNLFTNHPFHIAVGSIAPQNGFAGGAAFVFEKNTKNIRMKWNADAVGAASGAWRAGAYLKVIPTPSRDIGVSTNPNVTPSLAIRTHPIFNFYVQSISLPTINYFGLGTKSPVSDKSIFGMTETIPGVNAIVPFWSRVGLSVYGEMNGRFVSIRGHHGKSSPSIEQLFNPITAPGLDTQPGYIQFGEGLRFKHAFSPVRIGLNYFVELQEFIAPNDSRFSFRRFTADLSHEFTFYRTQRQSGANLAQGPDDCRDRLDLPCPKASFTRNREGSLTGRLLIAESIASAGSVVPFYFQQTLGGSDINGQTALASYQDYRFRDPNLILAQGTFEHVIWGPFGFTFTAEGGKVAPTRGDIGFDHFSHSFSTGFTVRAGALPVFTFQYGWAGESDHTTALLSPTLLGSTARPALQ